MPGFFQKQVLFTKTPRISAANSFTNLKAWKAIYDNYVKYKAVCLRIFLLYFCIFSRNVVQDVELPKGAIFTSVNTLT